MWPYHPELLSQPVPRYTSYPTAAEFHDGVGGADHAAALAAVAPETPVSLYVHIPYCRDICWYCGCNTGAANRSDRLNAYLDALEAEISLVGEHLGGRGRVTRIAFGGGSPNAISPLRFGRLLDALIKRFDAGGAGISIELDPRTLDKDWYDILRQSHVSRASLGVQTFSPRIQQVIGRVQPGGMITDTVNALRKAGIGSINFDLMYGLPGQTLSDLEDTLDRSIALAPDRIALFGYAHLPSVFARQRRIDATSLPGARERFDQAAFGYERLTAAGYRAIGFDHFALPQDPLAVASRDGALRRNFQGFTDDDADVLIGLGASAISEFPDLLVQNEKMAGRYRMLVADGGLPGRRGVRRSAADRKRGDAIERLLCTGEAEMGEDLLAGARPALGAFMARGLLRCDGGRLSIQADGMPYARAIAACLDDYRTISIGQFSHAV